MVKNYAALRMFSARIFHIGCKCLDFPLLLLIFRQPALSLAMLRAQTFPIPNGAEVIA